MRCWQRLLVVAIFTVVVVGCTTKTAPPDDVRSRKYSMVFGYVKAEDKVTEIDLYEFGKVYIRPFSKAPRVLVFDDGYFMAENIKPGKYLLAGYRSKINEYPLVRSKQQAYQKIIHVDPGELVYVGSYEIHVTKSRLLGKGKFEIDEVFRPGERQALRFLHRVTEGTGWQKMIERRLMELRQ